MKMLVFLLLLLLKCASGQFTVTVEEDATGIKIGERATLSAKADEDLDTCWFVSPDGVRYRADRDDSDEDSDRRRNRDRDNYRVRVDDDECTLTIERMKEEDEGPWEAHLDDGDDVVMRYAFLSGVGDVRKGGGNFVREHDKEVQYVEPGKYGSLDCPVRSVSGSATICTFTDPEGLEYVLVGRGARSYDGVTFEGEGGGCAIGIDRVKSRHLGDWKCKVLTPRRSGGSAVEYGYFSADEPRRSRLGSRETQQGFEEGEEADLIIRSDVYSDERSVKFFWIVGRKLRIDEGDEECDEDDDDFCYEALDRERVRGNSRSRGKRAVKKSNRSSKSSFKTYQLELSAVELSEEDVLEPIVLVKQFRKSGRRSSRGGDRFRIYYVSRAASPLRRGSAEELESGEEACVIDGERVEVEEEYEDDSLCVKVECVGRGAVRLDELRRCDRSK